MRSLVQHYLLPVSWTLLILALSLIPPSDSPAGFLFRIPYADKILHFLFYFVLAALWLVNLKTNQKSLSVGLKIALIIACSLFGGFVEVLQSFTPYRSMDALDWIADAAGATLAIVLAGHINMFKIWLVRKIRCLSFVFPS